MPLARENSIKQLKRVYKIMKKQGGDIGEKSVKTAKKSEEKMPNSLWINNPADGRRKIDTIEKNMNLKVEKFSNFNKIKEQMSDDIQQKVEKIKENFNKNVDKKVRLIIRDLETAKILESQEISDCFSDVKNAVSIISKKAPEMIDEIYKDAITPETDSIKENGANDDILTALRNNNTIRNWTTFNNVQQRRERPVHAGQYVEVGDKKGYINRIDGDDVYIDSIAPKESTIKDTEIVVKLKDVIKAYKPEKEKKDKEIVVDLSTQGPSQKSVAKEPAVSKSEETGIIPDEKSDKASDNKITKKINVEDDHKLKTTGDYGDTVIEKIIVKIDNFKKK